MKPLYYFCILLLSVAGSQNLIAQDTTARQVLEQMKKHLTCSWSQETVDTFKSGNPDNKVTGIAVCMFADMGTLKKAVENNCNFIIAHEPTFYNHLDKADFLSNNQVYQKKLEYIEKHGLIILRFHDHWHRTSPDGIDVGMIQKLGWKKNQIDSLEPRFRFKEQTVRDFAIQLQQKLKGSQLRIIGDPGMKFTNVALSAGACGSRAHINVLSDKSTELIVIGEATEWETYQYVRDASMMGLKKAAIITGHVASEEAGMEYCSRWLKSFITNVPVVFIENSPTFWSVPNAEK